MARQPADTQPLALASTNPYAAPAETASGGIDYAQQHNLASRPLRLAGEIIDWALYGLSTIPAVGVFGYADAQNNDALSGIGALLLFGGLILVGLVNWILISVSGQSLAKRLLGMRIVKTDGQLPGFLHGVLLRSWVLSLICACYPIGIIVYVIDGLFVFGVKRQCLHDLIANTLVANVE